MTQLVSEYRKLATWRAWWFLALGMVVGLAGLTAVTAFGAAVAPAGNVDLSEAWSVSLLYTMPAAAGVVFPLALGVLVVTREYSHRTATPAFLAEPRRARVFWSKTVMTTGASTFLAVASLVVCSAVVVGILSAYDSSSYLTSSPVSSRLGGAVVALVLWGLIGVGIGALIRNTVVAIVGVLVFTQFVEPIIRVALLSSSFPEISGYLPGGAGDALSGGTLVAAALGGSGHGQVAGGLILAAYAVVLLVAGLYRMRSTDVL